MNFLDQIRQTIARYQMLRRGCHLGVAVSGGADSLCLLHVLLELRPEFDLHLSIIHIDHNLRGAQSQADAQFVHNYAQQLSLPFHVRTLDLDPSHGNLEQEGRRARYQFFQELIDNGAVEKVALGHTLSDQAETVLFRLLRGAGSAGLAGIRPVTDFGIIRPMLQVTRPQVVSWLKGRDIVWAEDASNQDLRFDRNRIRHQLIPALEKDWNPAISETLAQTADWAFEEEQFWQSETKRLIEDWVRFAKHSAVLDVNRLNSFPVAVARRIVRAIVLQLKGDLLGVSFSHIEAVRKLATLNQGTGRLQIAGLDVCRSFDWLRFAKARGLGTEQVQNWQFCVTVPGHYVVPCNTDESVSIAGLQTTIELDFVCDSTCDSECNNDVYNRDVNALDWERLQKLDGSPVLRNWRPGDEYQRNGRAGREKIKEIFQNRRIPLWERLDWPIISVGDSVVWASRFGPAAQVAVDADSRKVLQISEILRKSD